MKSAGAGGLKDDREAELVMIDYRSEPIGPGIQEDMGVFLSQQRGFRSRGFRGAYLSAQEKRVRRYHELIDDYIEDRLPKRAR